MNYILTEDHGVQVEPDILKWGAWFEGADRVVAKTTVGDAEVSTVFLGVDHNFTRHGGPVLFETMVFGGPLDQEEERYGTWEAAETGHRKMVERAKAKGESDG